MRELRVYRKVVAEAVPAVAPPRKPVIQPQMIAQLPQMPASPANLY